MGFLPPSPSLFLPHIILLLPSLHTLRCSTPILSPLSTAVSPSLVVPTSCPTPLPQTPSFLPTSSLTTGGATTATTSTTTFSPTTSDLRTSTVVRSTLESQPSKKKKYFCPKKKKKKKKKK